MVALTLNPYGLTSYSVMSASSGRLAYSTQPENEAVFDGHLAFSATWSSLLWAPRNSMSHIPTLMIIEDYPTYYMNRYFFIF